MPTATEEKEVKPDETKEGTGFCDGKYKTVEELESAYKALEKMLGDLGHMKHEMKEAGIKNLVELVALMKKAKETGETGKPKKEPDAEDEFPDIKQLKNLIVDELRETGQFSDPTMEKIGEAMMQVLGVDEPMGKKIASMIRDTQTERVSEMVDGIRESLRGEMDPMALIAWANEHVPEEQLKVYQEMAEAGDFEAFRMVERKHDEWAEANPKDAESFTKKWSERPAPEPTRPKGEAKTGDDPGGPDESAESKPDATPSKPAAVQRGRATMTDQETPPQKAVKPFETINEYHIDLTASAAQEPAQLAAREARLKVSSPEIQAEANYEPEGQ